MKRICDDAYGSDITRIQRVLLDHGIFASPEECKALWDEHSASMAAGWLYLPEDDDDLYQTLYWRVDERLS